MTTPSDRVELRQPKGTQDILPDAWPLWRHVSDAAVRTAESSGYERIETPMFELTSLFTHATGEHTDVNREMYSFEDRGGEHLSLRPEGTAPVFRAYVQHGMRVKPQPAKLYYMGSMFRYERPQAGRWREHHQFGCEAIGTASPVADASLIDLQGRFYCSAGLQDLAVQLNSIGDENCRPVYLETLVAYLRQHADQLCGQCRERIDRNPLRVLDCKVESCQPILDAAPHVIDHLCDACREHWNGVRKGLDSLEIDYRVNHRLVRGLDYYTRTVWEYVPNRGGGSTSTIGGGGRYDALGAAMGATAVPGVGFSTGLERVLLHVPEGVQSELPAKSMDVFIAHVGDAAGARALSVLGQLLKQGLAAEMVFGSRSLKRQMAQAEASNARLVAIVGENELSRDVVTIRDMKSRAQWEEPGIPLLCE